MHSTGNNTPGEHQYHKYSNSAMLYYTCCSNEVPFPFCFATVPPSMLLPMVISGASIVIIIMVNVCTVCLCILATYRRHKQRRHLQDVHMASQPVGHAPKPVIKTTEICNSKYKDEDEDSLYIVIHPMAMHGLQ